MAGQRGGSAWWSSWLSVSMEGGCGGACREELPTTHGAAVRGLQSLCPLPLSPSFSLAKSTCKIPYRGEGKTAVKLLKFIFTGFDISTALLQALKCLFRYSCSVLFPCWWDQTEIYWTWQEAEKVIELYRILPVLITGAPNPYPQQHSCSFMFFRHFCEEMEHCSQLGPDFTKHWQPPTKCYLPLPVFPTVAPKDILFWL